MSKVLLVLHTVLLQQAAARWLSSVLEQLAHQEGADIPKCCGAQVAQAFDGLYDC